VTGDNTLLIMAYTADQVVKESIFIEGKDFKIENGLFSLEDN